MWLLILFCAPSADFRGTQSGRKGRKSVIVAPCQTNGPFAQRSKTDELCVGGRVDLRHNSSCRRSLSVAGVQTAARKTPSQTRPDQSQIRPNQSLFSPDPSVLRPKPVPFFERATIV